MEISALVLLSNEAALRRRMDVVANNIANLNTTGFKRETPVFREMVDKMDVPRTEPDGGRRVSFVVDMGVTHDTTQGAFGSTGNRLDALIDGDGYFKLQRPDGSFAYTRAGHFQVSATGQLVGPGGLPVLSPDGRTIDVPVDDAQSVSLAANGGVHGPQGELGRVGVFRFADEGLLAQAGDGLFDGPATATAAEVRLRVGGVESSNVNAVVETSDLVEIMRTYQTSQRLADSINDLRRRSLDRLDGVN